MAQEWRGLSNHQKAFAANKARASAAAEEITKEFVTSVTGAAIAEREAAEEEAAAEAGEFDIMEGARKILRSRRVKEADHAQERAERAGRRSEEHEAEQEGAAKKKQATEKAPVLTAKGRARQLAEATKGLAADELATIIASLEDRYESALDREANETAAAVGRAAKDGTLYDGDDDEDDELTGLE